MHFATPNWLPGTRGCGFICDCYGKAVTWHDPPLLYNIAADPAEKNLLDAGSHRDVIAKIQDAVTRHKAGVLPVVDQFAVHRMLPVPWLQPCCGNKFFPYCDCTDPVHPFKPQK